ncbi:hypothetical protein QT381_14140, partial [Galbitalea sp. SE-J8]|uniref:2-oxoglutarate dehydrogenase E1 subunit family protein n=1 Tax=Galbitalea sp. SE-J8 TaxID=3054952 RepID=UPI00259CBFF6
MSSSTTGVQSEDSPSNAFGANEWLVDEMYERYLVDRESVDRSWWPILENYGQQATESVPAPESQIGGEAQIPDAVAEPAAEPAAAAPAPPAAAPA